MDVSQTNPHEYTIDLQRHEINRLAQRIINTEKALDAAYARENTHLKTIEDLEAQVATRCMEVANNYQEREIEHLNVIQSLRQQIQLLTHQNAELLSKQEDLQLELTQAHSDNVCLTYLV